LGHYRRSIGLLSRIVERLPDVRIDVLCEKWQVERMFDWIRSRNLWSHNIKFITGVMEPGVRWSISPELYSDGRLLVWEERLRDIPALQDADLVLSDNLAGVLSQRPDAVLIGSFLWSDVLDKAFPDNKYVREFVEHERDLLARYKPSMLCVGDIAMPGVFDRTQAIQLPWFCEGESETSYEEATEPNPVKSPVIAILGGATSSAEDPLSRVMQTLALKPELTLALPSKALSSFASKPSATVIPFNYKLSDYAQCSAVVCRPGIGTLTDCIAGNVPIIAVYEPGNSEMAHNAKRIEELGFGFNLGVNPHEDRINETIANIIQNEMNACFKKRMKTISCDGFKKAVNWLFPQ